MRRPVPPFVVPPGGGRPLRGPVGGPVTIKADAATTNGALTALESVVAPGEGPPLHVHVREDEYYYVLAGQVRFSADDEVFDAEPGSFMFIPRGTEHCFANVGDEAARLLVLFSPAGMERFFEGVAALPPGPVDPATYAEVADRAWMRVVGPRPAL